MTRPIIDDTLAATWGLLATERKWFDLREGHTCTSCGTSKRVRMIVWSIRALGIDLAGANVLHFNQINDLEIFLRNSRSVYSTQFTRNEQPGADVNGLFNQDITELTFDDQTFDLAIHSETLEHVDDFSKGLQEVRRVLRPGGFQVYTVPLLHHRPTRRRARLRTDGSVEHLLPPSFHGLEQEDLVFHEFGGEFIRTRSKAVYRIFYDNFFFNPTVFVIVERSA